MIRSFCPPSTIISLIASNQNHVTFWFISSVSPKIIRSYLQINAGRICNFCIKNYNLYFPLHLLQINLLLLSVAREASWIFHLNTYLMQVLPEIALIEVSFRVFHIHICNDPAQFPHNFFFIICRHLDLK